MVFSIWCQVTEGEHPLGALIKVFEGFFIGALDNVIRIEGVYTR